VSQRIRITAKRREEVDVDKLVFALLRVVEQLDASQPSTAHRKNAEGGDEHQPEEPAA